MRSAKEPNGLKHFKAVKNKKIKKTSKRYDENKHKNATKNSDNITIADRFRTGSWSKDSQPTDVVKLVSGIPTFPLTTKAV